MLPVAVAPTLRLGWHMLRRCIGKQPDDTHSISIPKGEQGLLGGNVIYVGSTGVLQARQVGHPGGFCYPCVIAQVIFPMRATYTNSWQG